MARMQGGEEVLRLTARNPSQTSERPASPGSIKPTSPPARNLRPLVKHWQWEIFTFLLGTAAFATVLGLLLQARNKDPQSWRLGQAWIQLPAIIAALSQVAQSALLVPISYCIGQLKWKWFQCGQTAVDLDRFDLASRGPDGSIRLLVRLGWRQRLVSLGCIATVLMLVLPTFIQASIQIGEKELELQQDGHAVMTRSVNAFIDPTKRTRLFDPAASNGTAREVDTYLSMSLKAGFMGFSASFRDTAYGSCPPGTGKPCAWAPFKTLALCSSSEDISKDITQDNGHITLAALKDFLTLPNVPPLMQSGSFLYTKEGQAQPSNQTSQLAPETSTVSGTNLPNLAEVYVLYYDDCIDPVSGYNKGEAKQWKALRSRLQFCVQTVEAKYHEQTKVTRSKTELTWYKTTKFNETAFCTKVESETEDFCVSESLMEDISIQLSSLFNATALPPLSADSSLRFSSEEASILARDVFGNDQYLNPFCKAKQPRNGGQNPNPFEHVGLFGFQSRMKQIAGSLSDAFQTDHMSQEVLGSYIYKDTLVLVDFRWLILPGTLYAIVTIFFIATICTTRNTPIWKSSPLPVLTAAALEANSGSGDEIRKAARKRKMQLRRTGTGWKMSDAAES